MSHMFRVDYICNHASGIVENGKVIVVAESHDLAHDIVCQQLNLPPSRTRCESNKIKPSCYTIETHQNYPPERRVRVVGERDLSPMQDYFVTISVSHIRGHGEHQVLRKIGEELQARGSQSRLRHNLEMSIECSPAGEQRKDSTLSRIEMFGARRPTQGGKVT